MQPNPNTCSTGQGGLPGPCASLAYPFVSMQCNNPERYDQNKALATGTLFPGLDLPFHAAVTSNLKVNTALAELMALDFAIDELGLYLTTHPQDQEVLDLYWSYIKLANEGRKKYQEMYGPLLQTDLTPEEGYAWLNNPWPWEVGGND
ncbi:spore coat protein CotJB [Oscillibacter hominis]|nr:spore coat protein CotJB [Oscillibacter hominis]